MKQFDREPEDATGVAAALEQYAVEYRSNVNAAHFLRARKVVVDYFLTLLRERSEVLDINCGTGLDTIEIARHRHMVRGIDISSAMISFAKESIAAEGLSETATAEVGDYRAIPAPPTSFDAVISNFGGINFAKDLGPVFESVDRNLSEDGFFLVNSVSRFCLLELLIFAFKGKFGKAVRRLTGGKARIGGRNVRLYYHTRRSYRSTAERFGFKLVDSFGLNILTPPLWAEDFFRSRSKLTNVLGRLDDKIRRIPLIRSMGDFTVMVFRKASAGM